MKGFKTLILALALMLPSLSFAQSRLFSDLTDDSKIKTTYISSTMIKLASGVLGNSADLVAGTSIDVSKIINNVSSIEIVSTEKKNKVKKIQKALDKLKKAYDLQPLMDVPNSTSSKNETSQVLCETDDYTGLVSKIFYVKKEKSQMQVIVIQGNINISDLMK